jgi:hypothetical protein
MAKSALQAAVTIANGGESRQGHEEAGAASSISRS